MEFVLIFDRLPIIDWNRHDKQIESNPNALKAEIIRYSNRTGLDLTDDEINIAVANNYVIYEYLIKTNSLTIGDETCG